jgi:hypothetical protein
VKHEKALFADGAFFALSRSLSPAHKHIYSPGNMMKQNNQGLRPE